MAKSSTSVCIGIPCDDGHRAQFWISLIAFLTSAPNLLPKGTNLVVKWNLGDSLITRARNNLAHEFLHSTKCDYLLFLDTDLDFAPETLARLIRHKIKGIVCGQYAIKQDELRWCRNEIAGEIPNRRGLLKVADSGTGAMMIHRSVFDRMTEAMPDRFYIDDISRDRRFSFFDAGVFNNRYLSEDWVFCHRARALKFPVYADTGATFGHHGWARYPLNHASNPTITPYELGSAK